MNGRRVRAVLAVLAASMLAPGCGTSAAVRGRVESLNQLVHGAEQNGAARCAPRELALAKAHLRFASTDLAQGEVSEAARHVEIAEPNARAAFTQSPADECAPAKPGAGDRDADGIVDARDRCPGERETYNGFEDDDGCPDDPDTDGDGVPDARDACLLEPEDKDGYLDDDGCPEMDNDLDGVADDRDKCPNDPEDRDGFQDDDGCPDPDNDQDTVADVDDECPSTPGQPGGAHPGCPNLIVVTAKEIRIVQQIQFDFGRSTIKPVSFPTLDAVKEVLAANPQIALEVQGHTDNVGQPAVNATLSQARADAVRTWLVTKGIDGSRLLAKGYGSAQPLLPNSTDANRSLNRRVQFIRTESQP